MPLIESEDMSELEVTTSTVNYTPSARADDKSDASNYVRHSGIAPGMEKDYSSKNGNMFGSVDWTTGHAESVANDDIFAIPEDADDDFMTALMNESDHQKEETVDTSSIRQPKERAVRVPPALKSVSPKSYLGGDELSHHHGGAFTKDMFVEVPSGMKRVNSLSNLDKMGGVMQSNNQPCLMPMPGYSIDSMNSCDTSIDLSTLLQSIPHEGWIVPYIIAGAAILSDAEKKTKESKTKLSDVTFKERPIHKLERNGGILSVDDMRLSSRGTSSVVNEELKSGRVYELSRSRSRSIDSTEFVDKPHRTCSSSSSSTRIGNLFHFRRCEDDQTLDDSHYQPTDAELEEQNKLYAEIDSNVHSRGGHLGLFRIGHQKADKTSDLDDSHYHLTPGELLDLNFAKVDYDKQLLHSRDPASQESVVQTSSTLNEDISNMPKKRNVFTGHRCRAAGSVTSGLFRRKHESNIDELEKCDSTTNCNVDDEKGSTHEKRNRYYKYIFHHKKETVDDELDDSHLRYKLEEIESSNHTYNGDNLDDLGHKYRRDIVRNDTGDYVTELEPRDVFSTQFSSADNISTGSNETHSSGFFGGIFSRIRHNDDHMNTPEVSVHGDLVLSHDKDGVYLVSKPDHPTHSDLSSKHNSSNSLPRMYKDESDCLDGVKHAQLPKFMQFLFLCPNFHILGYVFACMSPQWGEWEKRRMFLWDNYLFEALTDNDGMPVGFANLSTAQVVVHRSKKVRGRYDKGDIQDPDYMIRLKYYRSTGASSPQNEIYLCGKNRTYTDDIFHKLLHAAKITVKDLYSFDELQPPMGTGRYSYIHRAVNRRLREKISHVSSEINKYTDQDDDHPEDGFNSADCHVGQCALKLINKAGFWSQVASGKERKDTLIREVLAQSQIINAVLASAQGTVDEVDELSIIEMELPIVQLNSVFETRENFVIDMELMKSSNLFDKLLQEGALKEKQVKHIAIQLVQAVALCQANRIAHRDIKLANITFPERTSENLVLPRSKHPPMQIKLADFGMAGFIEKDGYLRGRCGTPGYVAPEIFRSGLREGYSLNVDMFSVGVCIYSLLCGYEPFNGDSVGDIIDANKTLAFSFDSPEWSHISMDAIDFVQRAMASCGRNRLTVHEALDHPWMNTYAGTINYPPQFKNSGQNKSCVVS